MPHANVVCESLFVRRQNRFIRRLLPVIRVCVPGAGTECSPRAAPISRIRDLCRAIQRKWMLSSRRFCWFSGSLFECFARGYRHRKLSRKKIRDRQRRLPQNLRPTPRARILTHLTHSRLNLTRRHSTLFSSSQFRLRVGSGAHTANAAARDAGEARRRRAAPRRARG